jgi:DNA repair exonuclease SbcCD ATPase subunit
MSGWTPEAEERLRRMADDLYAFPTESCDEALDASAIEAALGEIRELLKQINQEKAERIKAEKYAARCDEARREGLREIERLREENRRLRIDEAALRGALGYEVHADYDGRMSDGTRPVCGFCTPLKAEIERLREEQGDLPRARMALDHARDRIAEQEAEIERLEGDIVQAFDKRNQLEAEIERLRGEVDPLKPLLNRNAALRSLLKRCLTVAFRYALIHGAADAPAHHETERCDLCDLARQVRAALGEMER